MSEPLPPELAALLRQTTLAQAADLARAGQFDAAEELLKPALAAQSDVATLDLLARIRAQRGALTDAENLWCEVLRREPEHSGAHAALARLRRIQSRPLWLTPLAIGAAGLVVALGLALLGRGFFAGQERRLFALRDEWSALHAAGQSAAERQSAALAAQLRELQAAQTAQAKAGAENGAQLNALAESTRSLAAQVAATQAQQRELAAQLQRLGTQHAAALKDLGDRVAVATTPPVPVPAPMVAPSQPQETATSRLARASFAVPGVAAVSSPGGVELQFAPGLFRSGVSWTDASGPTLAAVVGELAALGLPCVVEIAGTAGEIPNVFPWTLHRTPPALAFARALAVADRLRRIGLPAGVEVRVVADPSLVWPGLAAPDPRTVVLRIRACE